MGPFGTYIANRKDIWYVGFGHLTFIAFYQTLFDTKDSHLNSSVFELHQNYPI